MRCAGGSGYHRSIAADEAGQERPSSCEDCGSDGTAFLESIGIEWAGLSAETLVAIRGAGQLKYGSKRIDLIHDLQELALAARRDLQVERWTEALMADARPRVERGRRRALKLVEELRSVARSARAAGELDLSARLQVDASAVSRRARAPHPYDPSRRGPRSEATAMFRLNLVRILGRHIPTGGPRAVRLFERVHADVTGNHVAGARLVKSLRGALRVARNPRQ